MSNNCTIIGEAAGKFQTASNHNVQIGTDEDAIARMEGEGGVQPEPAERIDLGALPEGAIVFREQVLDNLVSKGDLQANWWECDPVTGNYIKCSPEFFAARAETEEALVQQRKDAQITLASAMLSIERDIPHQIDGRPSGIAENGRVHVTLASEPFQRFQEWCGHATPTEAVAAYKRALLDLVAASEGDTIWWRIRPDIDAVVRFGRTDARWRVYSRLTIGNTADVQPDPSAA